MRLILAVSLFIAANIAAGVELVRALRNLRPNAPSKFAVLASGYFAKREYFTDEGWQHRRNSINLTSLSVIPVVIAIMWP